MLFIKYVNIFTFDCISITFISIYESRYKIEAIYYYPTFNAKCTRSRLIKSRDKWKLIKKNSEKSIVIYKHYLFPYNQSFSMILDKHKMYVMKHS